ncbi:hypothetical protein [Nocardia pseudovaccinii]|uniref:hypothetical protein n=1 Tax=Nocardia pseudovaccinii TaxID=189540 RepID=UPI0012F484A5|nr:hypothetical protein [Nocardia pseudovaccinii]
MAVAGVTGHRPVTDCRNCSHYALAFREKAMNTLRVNHHPRATANLPLWEQPAPPTRTALTSPCP